MYRDYALQDLITAFQQPSTLLRNFALVSARKKRCDALEAKTYQFFPLIGGFIQSERDVHTVWAFEPMCVPKRVRGINVLPPNEIAEVTFLG